MKTKMMMLGLLLTCFAFTANAQTMNSRSYIAPSGSDNRGCTRSQPCRTFDGAMAKTEEGGEIVALETNTYDPVTVTKSVTLTAANGADVVIKATHGNAVTISPVPGATVVLRGLKLAGPGKSTNSNGVQLAVSQGSNLAMFIENCVISDFGNGVNVSVSTNARVSINDSVIRNNTNGLTVEMVGSDSGSMAVARTRFERNSVGVNAMGGNSVSIKESAASSNDIGFLARAGANILLFNCMATQNVTGVESRALGEVVIGYSIVSGNDIGMDAQGSIKTMGNNIIHGNESQIHGFQNVTALPPQ
ncbi:MAG TPA: hypothetical protein VFR78_10830 [Pyrinomonadaceae bacterium]|nr:hypothetical protein [Pyrinomonadaceae bacterium]